MSPVSTTIGIEDAPPEAVGPGNDPDRRVERSRPSTWRRAVERPALAYTATALVALWATRSFWWPGRYVVTFDGYTYAGPNLVVTEAATRAGRLALWNDGIFGGVTHLGNPQAGALYPPRLISLFLEDHRALGVLAAAHVVLLGLGMVALTLRLGLRPWAAGFVGVVAVLNGAVLTKSLQLEQILVLAWAPWVLVVIHATLTSRRPRLAIAATSVVTAAILLAGHPQLVFETIALAAALTIGLACSDGRWRRLPHLAAGVGLGAMIALPQLVAAAVATSSSVIRSGRDPALLLDPALSLQPGTGAKALLGTIADRDPAGFVSSFESVAFVGVLVVLLAVVGFVDALGRSDRRPWAISLAAVAALALVWSVGPRTEVFEQTTDLLPGFDLARVSARWLVVVVLVVCVFAGAGIEAVAFGVRRRHVVAVTATAAVGVVIIAVRHLHAGDRGLAFEWLVFAVVAVIAVAVATSDDRRTRSITAAIAAVVAAGSLGIMSLHSAPQQAATDTPFTSAAYRTATTDWLAGREGYVVSFSDDARGPDYSVPGLRPNANVLVGIRSIDGYDGGVQLTDRWAAALRRLKPDPAIDLPLRNSVTVPLDTKQLGRLGVHYVLIDRTRPIAEMVPGWLGPRATDEQFEVWENPAWVGEAIAWSSAEVVASQTAPDVLRDRVDELSSTALVTELGEPLTCDAATSACAPIRLEVDRTSPVDVIVRTDLDHRTLVTLDQQYDDGWRVTIDGVPTEVREVDGLIVGVDVPAGAHEIRWKYIPEWLWPTLVIVLVAVILTLWCALPRPVNPRAG